MSFGKDQKNLATVGSFRQTARMHQAGRPKFGGGGGGTTPYFINQFKPSTDDPDSVRLIRGAYEVLLAQQDGSTVPSVLAYMPTVEHFHATLKKGCICSAGPLAAFRDKRDPCLACEIYWADRGEGRKNGPMSKREMYVFTTLHYAPYAKVPQVDKGTGQVRKNDKGEPYTNWTRVLPHQRQQFAQFEQRDYNLMHWPLGFGHYNTLLEFDREIGRSCKSCGGRDSIKLEAWCCRGCGEALIDPSTTPMSSKEIETMTSGPVRCGLCQHTDLLQEYVSCSSCDNATRAEIFDVDLSVKRITVPDSNQTTLAVTSWTNPRPVDQRLTDIAKPLPLDKIYAPTPYEKQQEIFAGAAGGRAPVTGDQHSRPYGGGGAPTLGGAGNGAPGGGPRY